MYYILLQFRYPQRLGWQLKITRKDIRSSEAYYRLHNFLISETENGNISRQETVSMIPPLLLDVKPNDKVRFNLFIIVLFSLQSNQIYKICCRFWICVQLQAPKQHNLLNLYTRVQLLMFQVILQRFNN